jgi:broad specificity phosphatase PhoE
MRKAALYVHGRIVLGDSHLEAYRKLSAMEQNEHLISGVFDTETEEFDSELPNEHFYNKELLLIRHGDCEDPEEPDTELSNFGEEEIRNLARILTQNFDLKDMTGICSPMLRCLQTSLILHELLDIPFQIQAEVMEIPMFLKDDQQYRLQNHRKKFPQFQWPTSEDWILNQETLTQFVERTRTALQHLPHACIVVTHYGFICNLTRLALCDTKAIQDVPPGSVTHIDKNNVKCIGWTHAGNIDN